MKVLQGGPSRNMYHISIFDRKNPYNFKAWLLIRYLDSCVQDFETGNIHRTITVKINNNNNIVGLGFS
jgi:hypothetical protein